MGVRYEGTLLILKNSLKATWVDHTNHLVEWVQKLESMGCVLRNGTVVSWGELASLAVSILLRPKLESASEAEEVLVVDLMLLRFQSATLSLSFRGITYMRQNSKVLRSRGSSTNQSESTTARRSRYREPVNLIPHERSIDRVCSDDIRPDKIWDCRDDKR